MRVNPNMKKRVLCVSIDREVLDLFLGSRLLRSVAMIEGVWTKLSTQNREGIMGRKKKREKER